MFVLQPTVAAVAVACVTAPFVAPSAAAATAPPERTTASPVPAPPRLELVLAENPAVTTVGAAVWSGTSPGLEILALPEADAAELAAGGVGALPADVFEAGRQGAAAVLGGADARSVAFTPIVPTPTFLDVLGLPIQTILAITAGINPPPNTAPDPPAYTSVYTVINNAISVVRVPLALLFTGQFGDIAAQTQAALNTFGTSLSQGLPASVTLSLQYASDVLQTYLGSLNPQPAGSGAAARAVEATPGYTALDVLGLPVQTAFAILAGGTTGVTLPTSPLIPSPYTSVFTVVNNAVAVVRVPLSLAFTGQFDEIGPQTRTAMNTFVTSLTQGLPASIRGTLEYDASVVQGFLGGVDANALSQKAFHTADVLNPAGGDAASSTVTVEKKPESSTGYLDRLQTAVDKELSVVPASDETKAADSKTDEDKTEENKTEENKADGDKADGDKAENETVDDPSGEKSHPKSDDDGKVAPGEAADPGKSANTEKITDKNTEKKVEKKVEADAAA